jgi:hypothetical protein
LEHTLTRPVRSINHHVGPVGLERILQSGNLLARRVWLERILTLPVCPRAHLVRLERTQALPVLPIITLV